MASAETLETAAASGDNAAGSATPAHQQRTWEYGPFINYGNGLGNRDTYKFLSAGLQLGKQLFPVTHSGSFELGVNIMPLWQAYTPAPHEQSVIIRGVNYGDAPYGGGTYRGVSITPVIFRWNFPTWRERIQPWLQGAGGVIYTTHKFPPNLMSNNNPANGPIIDGGTSIWNFTPQGGIGVHYFLKSKRSIDLGVNAMHISSASLGDRNPGVNASIQIQAGYTFWK